MKLYFEVTNPASMFLDRNIPINVKITSKSLISKLSGFYY